VRQASDAFWATVWRAAFIDRISRSLQNCNDWQDKIFTVTEDRLSVRSSAQTSCLSPDALAPPNLEINARKFFVGRDNQDDCLWRLRAQLTNPVKGHRGPGTGDNEEDPMKTKSLVLSVVIGAGLTCGLAAQEREQPGEMVHVKSLPASVQQTINQKAAGGEIVGVKREDDANGRWNYEVVVRSQGKNGDLRSTRTESSSGRTAR
jgi:hypothetical protein